MVGSLRSNGAVSDSCSGSIAWVARCTLFRQERRHFPSIVITFRTNCSSLYPGRANIGLARPLSRFAPATLLPPAGAQAHQLINTGPADLRYLGVSTGGGVDVVDYYPDSKKIAVAAGVKNADFKTATYVGLGRLAPTDYYDGEDD